MSRSRNASLGTVGSRETDFLLFDSMGYDGFEGAPAELRPGHGPTVLHDCITCHGAEGIYSVNSYIRLLSPHYLQPPKLYSGDVSAVIKAAIGWKEDQFCWGLLQGLWNQPD
ncbi:MAG: hypothetical protein ACREE6_01180 [Limisphaerales bacterium]